MTTVLSGIQPTGQTHLGNYLGALRWWVDFQHEADAFYCIVDLHALTTPQDPVALGRASLTMATLLLAAGLDPAECTLFLQSHVPAHAQLAWLLECTATMGEMRRMTQFKDKSVRSGEEGARVGLFAYPILMAADILLYGADRVPVGDDQRQHLELTRNLAQRFNRDHGDVFVVPEAAIPPTGAGARIMDLAQPTAKMSKSAESDAGVIYLFDDPAVIDRKIRRAVTDTDDGPGSVRWDREAKPGVSNLLELLAVCTGRTPLEVADDYTRYGDLKKATAEAVIELVAPIQARHRALADDPGAVTAVLAAGAERARSVASATYGRAAQAVGLVPPPT